MCAFMKRVKATLKNIFHYQLKNINFLIKLIG